MSYKSELAKLRISLTEAIEKWVLSVCETDTWIEMDAAISENTELLMADAAMAVLEAVVETANSGDEGVGSGSD